jgi:hypothetical protein
MVKVKVKQNVSNQPKFLLVIIFFSILLISVIFGTDKTSSIFNKQDSIENSPQIPLQTESLLSKEENLLTFNEWKKIADYRSQEFFECTKNLAKDLESFAVYESCHRQYNNAWVIFRLGVEEKANLNYEQREQLLEYWKNTRDNMKGKITKQMEINEKKLRPNKYNDN